MFENMIDLMFKNEYDVYVFDTAPTGHTLRLLSLPKAWTGFLDGNDRGASCLGPHSGLKMQEDRFKTALRTLADPVQTSIVLVTRPDHGAGWHTARASLIPPPARHKTRIWRTPQRHIPRSGFR